MISRNLSLASLALLLAAPAFGVTAPEASLAPATAKAADQQLTDDDFDLDEDDLDADDDQVTEEDMNDDTEIADTPLGAEQEAEESLTVEPKDDGQDVAQAAEEYLSKTTLKDAEIAEAAPAPRTEQVAVQIPSGEPEVAPVREPAAIATALTVQPVDLQSTAFVTRVQQALIAQGAAIEVDGQMGSKTKAALLEYQKKNGLAADGVTGPGTLTKLGVGNQGAERR